MACSAEPFPRPTRVAAEQPGLVCSQVGMEPAEDSPMDNNPSDSKATAATSGHLDAAIVEDLLSLSDGDPEFVEELFSTFQTTAREGIGRLRLAVQSADHDAIRREAHSLRGTSANVGASLLQHLCAALEDLAPNELGTSQGLFDRIELEFETVCDSMEQVTL